MSNSFSFLPELVQFNCIGAICFFTLNNSKKVIRFKFNGLDNKRLSNHFILAMFLYDTAIKVDTYLTMNLIIVKFCS